MSEWIEWKGGNRPIPAKTMVSVKLANGSTDCREAADFTWVDVGPSWSIIAYKVEKPAADPAPFDPTKLRKGDRVLVEFEVEEGGVDSNQEIRTVEAIQPGYMPIKKIIGYAPGYTPTPDPIPDEWAKAYAEAYPDRVREYVRDKMELSE